MNCNTCGKALIGATDTGRRVMLCLSCGVVDEGSLSAAPTAKTRRETPTGAGTAVSKYRNQACEDSGERFDSRKELRVWKELLLRESAGEIQDLRRQVRYELRGQNGGIVARYVADFCWQEAGREVVADAKSEPTKTRLYRLKKRLMKDNYGIEILEI